MKPSTIAILLFLEVGLSTVIPSFLYNPAFDDQSRKTLGTRIQPSNEVHPLSKLASSIHSRSLEKLKIFTPKRTKRFSIFSGHPDDKLMPKERRTNDKEPTGEFPNVGPRLFIPKLNLNLAIPRNPFTNLTLPYNPFVNLRPLRNPFLNMTLPYNPLNNWTIPKNPFVNLTLPSIPKKPFVNLTIPYNPFTSGDRRPIPGHGPVVVSRPFLNVSSPSTAQNPISTRRKPHRPSRYPVPPNSMDAFHRGHHWNGSHHHIATHGSHRPHRPKITPAPIGTAGNGNSVPPSPPNITSFMTLYKTVVIA